MIASLPFHPLIVHLAVVAVPVAVLLSLALSIRPTFYPKIGKLTVGVVTVASAAIVLAKVTGESLHDNPRAQRSAAGSGVHAHRACRRQRHRLRDSLPHSSRIATIRQHSHTAHHHGSSRRCCPSLATPNPTRLNPTVEVVETIKGRTIEPLDPHLNTKATEPAVAVIIAGRPPVRAMTKDMITEVNSPTAGSTPATTEKRSFLESAPTRLLAHRWFLYVTSQIHSQKNTPKIVGTLPVPPRTRIQDYENPRTAPARHNSLPAVFVVSNSRRRKKGTQSKKEPSLTGWVPHCGA
ncbi:hypothetical protein FRC0484_00001 [Corynebacterium diphtheriae]|nr:hypothetical protein FRC0484_00001 [Corynebacterium diphtheriae]